MTLNLTLPENRLFPESEKSSRRFPGLRFQRLCKRVSRSVPVILANNETRELRVRPLTQAVERTIIDHPLDRRLSLIILLFPLSALAVMFGSYNPLQPAFLRGVL